MKKTKAPADNLQRMRCEAPVPLILRFALPAIFTMIISCMYNMVDQIFIGQFIGSLGRTATTIGKGPMLLENAMVMLFGTGGGILLALELGENKNKNGTPNEIVGSVFLLQVIVGVVITILGEVFLAGICRLAGAGEESLAMSKEYLGVIFLGALGQCVGAGMIPLVRSAGCPKQAMVFAVAGSLLNCALDPLFIIVFRMGVGGAAIATVISQYVSALLVLLFLLRGKAGTARLRPQETRLHGPRTAEVFRLGLPSTLMNLCVSVYVCVLGVSLQYYGNLDPAGGDIAISAMGISTTIGEIIALVGVGMSQGAAPLIGFSYGARLYKRMKKIYLSASAMLLAALLVLWAILELFPVAIISIFGEMPDMALAVLATRAYNLALPMLTVQMLGTMFLQSIGETKYATIASLSRNLFLALPLVIILPLVFGVRGVYYGGPLADTGGAIVSGVLLVKCLRRLPSVDEPEELSAEPSPDALPVEPATE